MPLFYRRSIPIAFAALAAALVTAPGGARAQAKPAVAEEPRPPVVENDAETRQLAEKRAREAELKQIENRIAATGDNRAKLDAEIAAIRLDRSRMNAALLDTTAKVQSIEERIAALDERLSMLDDSAVAIRRSFEGRQAVIVEVLAALQRMGRRQPPAVLASPDDMLAAVRTSILLGAVVPELRAEADTLAADLAELVRLSDSIKTDQNARKKEIEAIVLERQRLTALIEARQARLVEAEKDIAGEGARAVELAKQVNSLKELIQRLESELSAGQRNAEAARKAQEALKDAQEKLAGLAFKDPARLAPKITFANAKGQLLFPMGGSQVSAFGSPDGSGGKAQGLTLSGRPGAIVSAPSDGWVSYAGPFRSFGQLLIINAGDGYYVLLAGMDRINVALGQFVLAGEPVAVMGDATAAPAGQRGSGADGPHLYIEFRKDGGAIDPTPWWAKSQGEKVRG